MVIPLTKRGIKEKVLIEEEEDTFSFRCYKCEDPTDIRMEIPSMY